MTSGDTIVAISSAGGPAARMVVRLSGPTSLALARALVNGADLPHASATRLAVTFDGLTFPSWVYAFHGPRSFTGEDLVELHVPGNPLLARMLVSHLLSRGARPAEAGEFTARAYFNGKLDLTAAEGVAAAVGARSEAELRAARQLLAGELAARVRPILDAVAETLALLEVGIDFSDEDVSFLSPAEVDARVGEAIERVDDLRRNAARVQPAGHEPTAVLVGRPNAGKSTLLNALAGHERAVTSPVAGTTRDVVTATVALRRGIVRLMDVAGLDDDDDARADEAAAPSDPIAAGMRRKALAAVESADVVVLVSAADDARPAPGLSRPADLVVRTKSDLAPFGSADADGDDGLRVCAPTGVGLSALRDRLDAACFGAAERDALALNARHLSALDAAALALARAVAANASAAGPELVAADLREAVEQLGEVVGAVAPDDLLGRIFARFCIGK